MDIVLEYKKISLSIASIISVLIIVFFFCIKNISFYSIEPLPCPLPERAFSKDKFYKITEISPVLVSIPEESISDKNIKNNTISFTDNKNNTEYFLNTNNTKYSDLNNSDSGELYKEYEIYDPGKIKPETVEINFSSHTLDFNKEFEKHNIKMGSPKMIFNPSYSSGDLYFTPRTGPNILTKAELAKYCEMAGAEFGVDPAYLEAMAETESGLNVYARNGSHHGLFQISSHWHAGRMAALGVTDLYDPLGNVRVAAMIVRDLALENPDPAYILMCYNQGQKSAIPMYNSGQISGYAMKIINRRNTIVKTGYV